MAPNLVKPLQGRPKVTRGFAAHVKDNPNTWYGIDYAVSTGTSLITCDDGYISHSVKDTKGGGYSFILHFNKYPGWMAWYAHCSQIPANGAKFKRGQVVGKSGATGFATGPHLHFSILHQEGKYYVPKNPDDKNVVKWEEVNPMADKIDIFKNIFITVNARWPNTAEITAYQKHPEFAKNRPYTYIQQKYLYTNWVKKSQYDKDIASIRSQLTKLEEAAKTAQTVATGLQGRVKELEASVVTKDKEITELKQQLAMPDTGVEKPKEFKKGVSFWEKVKAFIHDIRVGNM